MPPMSAPISCANMSGYAKAPDTLSVHYGNLKAEAAGGRSEPEL